MEKLHPNSTLTPEEQRFIVQALNQLNLTGQPAELRQALRLIDSITRKLQPAGDEVVPHKKDLKQPSKG